MVIVVKVGGRALRSNIDGLTKDIARLQQHENIVFVHGGGDMVTEMCKKLGVEPKFVVSPEGIRSRYTDENELEVYIMVMAGKVNKLIVSKLIALNVKAIGISGADGPVLIGERKKKLVIVDERGRKRVIDGGYTGRIVRVEADLLRKLLSEGYVVVVAPIAIDSEGTLLNVDGDQAAYAIASTLRVDTLVILTDVEGVIVDGNVVRKIMVSQIDEMVKCIGFGMNRKVMLAKKSIEDGVGKVIISSGLSENPVTKALKGEGTIIDRG